VKVTPAHDINDFEISRRSGAPLLNILTRDARLNENVPPAFRGMSREEGRGAVLEALEEGGLVAGSKPHAHTVPRCYRCDTVVEPRLSKQWFVRMEPLAEPALQASRDGVVTFVPGRRRNDYEKWMENIRDWCVSRQLWWGHRSPVWYCGCGNIFAALEDPDACPACGSADLEQDPDVLDTWFSSALWPFSTMHWPEGSGELETFYPTQVLVTGFEDLVPSLELPDPGDRHVLPEGDDIGVLPHLIPDGGRDGLVHAHSCHGMLLCREIAARLAATADKSPT